MWDTWILQSSKHLTPTGCKHGHATSCKTISSQRNHLETSLLRCCHQDRHDIRQTLAMNFNQSLIAGLFILGHREIEILISKHWLIDWLTIGASTWKRRQFHTRPSKAERENQAHPALIIADFCTGPEKGPCSSWHKLSLLHFTKKNPFCALSMKFDEGFGCGQRKNLLSLGSPAPFVNLGGLVVSDWPGTRNELAVVPSQGSIITGLITCTMLWHLHQHQELLNNCLTVFFVDFRLH